MYDIIKSDIFDRFSCTAEKCRYTCCFQWNIYLTKSDYMRLKNKKISTDRELNDKIHKYIIRRKDSGKNDNLYAQIKLEKQCCPFLDNGLCSMQKKAGYQVLPFICKTFPRAVMGSTEFGVEKQVSSSCEEVVRMLTEHPEKLYLYVEKPDKGHDARAELTVLINSAHVAVRPVLNYYWDMRVMCMNILQNRNLSMDERMLCLGTAMRKISEAEKSGDLEEIPKIADSFNAASQTDAFAGIMNNTEKYNMEMIQIKANVFFNVIIANWYLNYEGIYKDIFKNLNMSYETTAKADGSINVGKHAQCDTEKYKSYTDIMMAFENFNEYILENLTVNMMLEIMYPFNNIEKDIIKQDLFDNYCMFAALYGIMKFYISGHMAGEPTVQKIIDAAVFFTRDFVHNSFAADTLKRRITEHELNSLGRIAVFLNS